MNKKGNWTLPAIFGAVGLFLLFWCAAEFDWWLCIFGIILVILAIWLHLRS